MKRIIIVSDFHCGHRLGLTLSDIDEGNHKYKRHKEIRNAISEWFKKEVRENGPYDMCIANGDLIDGKGTRSGGIEQLMPDRNDQKEEAVNIIRYIDASENFIVRGTPYHVGNEENWEDIIADTLNCTVHDRLFIEIEGVVFDVRHKIGSSSVPHGRATALLKEGLWNTLWSEEGVQPKAQVIIRSHVHYCVYAGTPGHVYITTPSLQGLGSTYGARQCSGTVHTGFLVVECHDSKYDWMIHSMPLKIQADPIIKR